MYVAWLVLKAYSWLFWRAWIREGARVNWRDLKLDGTVVLQLRDDDRNGNEKKWRNPTHIRKYKSRTWGPTESGGKGGGVTDLSRFLSNWVEDLSTTVSWRTLQERQVWHGEERGLLMNPNFSKLLRLFLKSLPEIFGFLEVSQWTESERWNPRCI